MPGLGAALGEALGPVTDDDILAAFGMRRGKPAPSLGKVKLKLPQPRGNEAYWRARLAGQGSIKATPKTLGSVLNAALASGLTKAGVDERHSSRLAQRATSLLNDATPVGNVIGAEEGGRQFYHGLTKGDLGQMALGAGTFGLSVIPGSAAAKKVTGNVFGKMLADEAGAIRAWHGSPHDFDRFDMSKIGTGEGAQAYGHGLYFAENKDVANQYRDNLGRSINLRGAGFDPSGKPNRAGYVAELLDSVGPARIGDIQDALRTLEPKASDKQIADWIAEGQAKFKAADTGRLYEVNINAEPEDFLDWDRPLSEQPRSAQDLAAQFKPPELVVDFERGPIPVAERHGGHTNPDKHVLTLRAKNGQFSSGFGDTRDEALAMAQQSFVPSTGARLYEDFARLNDGSAAQIWARGSQPTSHQFRNAGIPGIRYLDQGSRQTGGTSNYVVFDDSLIDILNKF